MSTNERPPRNRGQQYSRVSNPSTPRSRGASGGGSNGRGGSRGGDGNGSNRNSRDRSNDLTKSKRKWSWRTTWWALFFTTAVAIFVAVGGYLFILLNGERLMKEYEAADMFELAEASIVYDRHGTEIARLGTNESNREVVEVGDIPEMLADAFIATEDQRFWNHSGVDLWSIGRAMVKDVIAGSIVEGGSTITQQLAKNMFLSSDKTLFRKATEVSIALAIENHRTKDEIITMYLNRIYFGKGAYGVKAAAKKYFDKDNLEDLEIWEMATLAAIPKAPSHYNPISNPEKSKNRRAVVLQLMYDQGYITMSEMDEAKAVDYEPINSSETDGENKPTQTAAYQSFIDYMMQEIEDTTGLTEDQLYRGGYKITTTMDSNAQKVMFDEFNKDSNFEKSKDEIKSQSSMVITDHSNGAIMAMMGGRDYARKGLNRATVKRQPGSAFKPIVSFGPALNTGEWFPWSTVRDDKQCFKDYCPTDLGSNKYVGAMDMETAVKKSTNLPAVWLLNEIGLKQGYEFAKKLGIDFDENDYNLSLALGGMTRGTTPIELAEAYNVFANGGKFYPAYTVKQIVDRKDKEVFKYKVPQAEQVMTEHAAYYMTKMLQEVVNSGIGTQAKMNRPVAGKTGSTQHAIPGYNGPGIRDLWFAGYTPEWTATVWMGYDKTDRNHVLLGSSGQPASLFSKVMTKALRGIEQKQFLKPSGVKDEVKPDPNPTVTGLNAMYSESTKSVTLNWNPIDGDGVKYHLYRKSSKDTKFTKILANLQMTTVEDIGVFAGETYTYYVTATSDKNKTESPKSNEATITLEGEVEPESPVIPEPPVTPPVTDPNEPGNPEHPGNGDSDHSGNENEGSQVPDEDGNGSGENNNDQGPTGGGPADNNPAPGNGNGESGGNGFGAGADQGSGIPVKPAA